MNGSDQSRPKDSFSMVENTPNHSELMLEASDAQKSFLNGMQEVSWQSGSHVGVYDNTSVGPPLASAISC